MRYVSLGETGLQVSRLALGTAAFGIERYGIQGADEPPIVEKKEAIRLVRATIDAGFNLFDTARSYGESESVLGEALANESHCVVATKVSIPPDISVRSSADQSCAVRKSLETSLRALRRDTLDIVQIHNATRDVLEKTEILGVLQCARQQGNLRFVGASVYGEDAALAAVGTGCVDVLQIAVNLLDQRMLCKVVPQAEKANTGVLARSAFLKGALTERARLLPPSLVALSGAANRLRDALGETWGGLPSVAVRFCLSLPGIHSVLLGLRNISELQMALEAEASGPLDDAVIHQTSTLNLTDESLLNPSYWPSL